MDFNEDDRLTKLYDDYHKMTCDSWYGNHRDCHSKLDEIKNLEFTIILERYKRLLNNYYLTLVNYLSTCSDFEESCETGHGNPRCGLLNKSDITGKNITGIKLKELWKDFLISDKDGKYKWNLKSSKALLNVEEVMGIGVIEDIELFKAAAKIELICPHVMDTTKRLPGEDDEYFALRTDRIINTAGERVRDTVIRNAARAVAGQPAHLLPRSLRGGRMGGGAGDGATAWPAGWSLEVDRGSSSTAENQAQVCDELDRISNISNIIINRLQLDKYIESLGTIGKLLSLTYESGLLDLIENKSGIKGGNKIKRKRKKTKNKTRKSKTRKNKTKNKKKKNKYEKKYKHSITGGSSLLDKTGLVSVIAVLAITIFILFPPAGAGIAAAGGSAAAWYQLMQASAPLIYSIAIMLQIIETTYNQYHGLKHDFSCVDFW